MYSDVICILANRRMQCHLYKDSPKIGGQGVESKNILHKEIL